MIEKMVDGRLRPRALLPRFILAGSSDGVLHPGALQFRLVVDENPNGILHPGTLLFSYNHGSLSAEWSSVKIGKGAGLVVLRVAVGLRSRTRLILAKLYLLLRCCGSIGLGRRRGVYGVWVHNGGFRCGSILARCLHFFRASVLATFHERGRRVVGRARCRRRATSWYARRSGIRWCGLALVVAVFNHRLISLVPIWANPDIQCVEA